MTTSLGRAGAETQLVRLALGLQARGVSVRGVISLLPPSAFQEELAHAGIPLISLNWHGMCDPRAIRQAVRLLRTWQPSVLVNFLFHANIAGRITGRLAGIPVIVSSVRSQHFGGRLRQMLLRATDGLGAITTTNSQRVAEYLLARHTVPSHRLRVIPNGIATDDYHQEPTCRHPTRQTLGIHADEFLWLAAGRLSERKDYPTLIKAFAELIVQHPHVRLVIAGQGPLASQLKTRIIQLQLEDFVRLIGESREMPALLQAADGFVLSSIWEGLPNVVMESLAAGTPVVATQVGGVPELIEEGRTGFLVPPQAPGQLAGAMARLMQTPLAERQQMAFAGQQTVASRYESARIIDEWDKLFRELLTRHGQVPVL